MYYTARLALLYEPNVRFEAYLDIVVLLNILELPNITGSNLHHLIVYDVYAMSFP